MPDNSPLDHFRIDSLEPADEDQADLFYWQITLSVPELTVLAQHHQGNESFLALHDGTMTWDIPGSPQLIAVHLTREERAGTFRYASARMPLLPLAEQWLVARGCPAEKIRTPPDSRGAQAADTSTRALEAKLAASPGRYEILDHYTDDTIDHETTVLLHDHHPSAARQPYRLLLEQVDLDAFTYTLREGAFATEDAAQQGLQDRPGPLPGPASATASTLPRPPAAPHRPAGPTP
ncbi:hypothetical protein G4Z16_00770 [Streptomyces bathyalis]|uniref:Glycosyl hydrolase n=1 Tax=Streptomyces bathyalis TaxID=2710756 RepID=A0A7T1T2I5_9ACTN|nr:hypothetical protein [Streptomyces bathyalis]QPP05164.1 hypothetical protein G4Z16_00770 [Streptomyces bathyalis]